MPDDPLSKAEVEALQHKLSQLAPSSVREEYILAHARCCLGRGQLPTPAEVQRFLSTWKVLWRWQQKERNRR